MERICGGGILLLRSNVAGVHFNISERTTLLKERQILILTRFAVLLFGVKYTTIQMSQ